MHGPLPPPRKMNENILFQFIVRLQSLHLGCYAVVKAPILLLHLGVGAHAPAFKARLPPS